MMLIRHPLDSVVATGDRALHIMCELCDRRQSPEFAELIRKGYERARQTREFLDRFFCDHLGSEDLFECRERMKGCEEYFVTIRKWLEAPSCVREMLCIHALASLMGEFGGLTQTMRATLNGRPISKVA